MIIIGVGHQKNVGKDKFVSFCIDILRQKQKKRTIVREGFADRLYEFCYLMYSWAGFQKRSYYIDNPDKKECVLPLLGKTPRNILIEVGNKLREYDPDIWLNAVLKQQNADILFLSDVRFPNETEAVLNSGGITVKITRPNLPIPSDEADTALNGYDRWSVHIHNDGDLANLYRLASDFLKGLKLV